MAENQDGKWICKVCKYIYDPAIGDDFYEIPAGTAWEDLPEDWCCPNCSSEKDMFEPLA